MSPTPREILLKWYEAELIYTSAAPDQRDFSSIAAILSDDFYLPQSSSLPWAGEYHGPEGMRTWLQQVSEWVAIDVRDTEFFEREGSNKIVVISQCHFHCHKTGKDVDFPLSQTIVVDREEGKIKEIRPFYWDITKLNAAMGYGG